MKKIIIAVIAVIVNSTAFGGTTTEEIRQLLGKMEGEMISKENEIEAVRLELVQAKATIAKMEESPDLEKALRTTFEKALTGAKSSVEKLTEEIVIKINSLKK